jgi:hypothetical protein
MSALVWVQSAESPGRIDAHLDGVVIGHFNNYKRVCWILSHGNRYTYEGFFMLSEWTWRLKVEAAAGRQR